MLLGNLLNSTDKKYQKIPVKGISFDSRKLKKKDVFFAIKGNNNSGLKFINEAIQKGASAIICSKKINNKENKIPIIKVKNIRRSLAEASANFYKKKPSNIVAITGTNGKSSVADFFYQILALNNIPVASIGTLGILSKKYSKKTNLTTMDPVSLHRNLELLKSRNVNHVVLEASSHGLDQNRLDNLKIKIGIFTNLSHDHLDYHKNMKSYLDSKLYLFRNLLKKKSKIITDEDNKEFKKIKKIIKTKKLKKNTIGSNTGNLRILKIKNKDAKQLVKINFNSKIFLLQIPLIGNFQIKNLFMAILAALDCGLDEKKIFNQIGKIKPVSGRLECVSKLNNNSNIIVDFAHTPDALEQSLIALKKQFNQEIVIVFGCGGERDKKKRFIMGKIAKKYCRKIFVTDDNPRNENPKNIRKDIIRGCKKSAVEVGNRKKAIQTAIDEIQSNEILLIAGKGHEKTQNYGNKIINFSDKKVIKELVKKKKNYFNKKYYQDKLAKDVFNNNNITNLKYNGVSINTKIIKKNDLFFAIKGKRNDGHNFVTHAIKKGATKSVVSRNIKKISKKKLIKVKNTFFTLNHLARFTRKKTRAQIVGITGSAGKTTCKNIISFALNKYGKVHKSPFSYNNKFGVPLSVSNLKKDTEYGVFEIGMDKKGEIKNLSKIVRPEIAVITNISEAHIKNFKSLKEIAKAKAEIIENIENNGDIVLNKDDKFFNFLYKKSQKHGVKVTTFSFKREADVYLKSIKKIKNYYKLKIVVKNNIFYFKTKISSYNFISNFLACIAVLYIFDLDIKKIKNNFVNFSLPDGRGDIKNVKKFNKRFKFIDESYNANPLSMRSAIKNINDTKVKNEGSKFIFLGDMLELGIKAKALHKNLSVVINKSDIDKVFVYGKHIKETFKLLSENKKGKIFNSLNEAYSYFSKNISNNDLLMIKGSNATGLNQFSKNIKKDQTNAL